MEYEPYNVRDIEDMPYRHWWYKAHNLTTRLVWDILVVSLETDAYHWRCCGAGHMATGSASSLDEAKLNALDFARKRESSS